ncbi:MAG TPA: SAF domain-containing protein [Drouetiella sp.]
MNNIVKGILALVGLLVFSVGLVIFSALLHLKMNPLTDKTEVTVVFSTKHVHAGETFESENLKEESILERKSPVDAFHEISQVAGRRAKSDVNVGNIVSEIDVEKR